MTHEDIEATTAPLTDHLIEQRAGYFRRYVLALAKAVRQKIEPQVPAGDGTVKGDVSETKPRTGLASQGLI